jgi:hypothetical protein
VYVKLLYLAKLKLVAFFATSEFPAEIPRSQKTQLLIHQPVGKHCSLKPEKRKL